MKAIIFTREAARVLRSAPANTAQKIMAKLELYSENPAALANQVKAMQGKAFKDCLRLRVGDWRVIFSAGDTNIAVHKIGKRGEIYR